MPGGIYTRTKEHCKKISIALKGNKNCLGNIHSSEAREKISKSLTGKHLTNKTKEKISKWNTEHPNKFWLGKKRSQETIEKIRQDMLKQKGESGRAFRASKTRRSYYFRIWRLDVLERDNWTCQSCGKDYGPMSAHHIIPFEIEKARFNVNNGITLCGSCHSKLHKNQTFRENFYKSKLK